MKNPMKNTAKNPMESATISPITLADASTHASDDASLGAPLVMRVKKRSGALEPVNINKIVLRVTSCTSGLKRIDPMRVATRAISGLYDGAPTTELDELCIQTAALLISEEPEYSKLASRLLSRYVDDELALQGIHNFQDSIAKAFEADLIAPTTFDFVKTHRVALESAILRERTQLFEYFGLRVLCDRYLLKDPKKRSVIENPQFFFMRVACGLSKTPEEAIQFYQLMSSLEYLPSSPTLFNSGTRHSQMSSCYLLDSPVDSLESIYNKYTDVAKLSKFAGGIGIAYHRIRSRGSLIKGTNGHSNGIVPWLKTLDSSVAAVNQGGKRKGACCVYLETWHADIESFLELRDNTGDEACRTHNINLANWVSDLFMRRVQNDESWSLFDPKDTPELVDTYGETFERHFLEAEKKGLAKKQMPARELYSRMMKTLAQTGNGWMTFKDRSNELCNQTGHPDQPEIVHLSNLCTEIIEVTSQKETAVCNLGSINLGRHVLEEAGKRSFDFKKLRENVRTAVTYLDRVIDINYYPISTAEASNNVWRPIGLGIMGLQDLFFALGLPFDAPEAIELSAQIQEAIYLEALLTSCDLAKQFGPHANYPYTKAAKGLLQPDLWGAKLHFADDWKNLKARIKESGLRNSLLIAIAPTATIASIAGAFESNEPQVSNLFKRETLSGEFLQINRFLVEDLRKLGLWNEHIRTELKQSEGSVQNIAQIPAQLKMLYRTAWEIPMKSIIDSAAARAPFIDQSQSLNLFMESPSIGKLSSMYMYAWQRGLKTTYYLRSRPATTINKVSTKTVSDEQAVACSLENPESCEACQ